MIRRELVHHDERHDENEYADKRENHCIDDIADGAKFILFASGVVVIGAVNRTVRAGIVAHRLGNVFEFIDAVEAPAAGIGQMPAPPRTSNP